ncbi:hypothetical protein Syun_007533 [Stephania yunnanensis]|uniref:Uncharacterized protein n=1 Tax=Stephania yunnanensis TaxID=152371 RepID=A0AAP0L0D7_9MAGN
MGKEARRTLEHALGTMPRHDPRTHVSATPSRWDSTEPRLAPEALTKSKYAWSHFGMFPIELKKRLNIYYRERCVLSGRHGQRSKEDPRACLGHHAKAGPSDPCSGHPEPVGLDRAPASTEVPGRSQASPRSPCPYEKCGSRPLRLGWTEPRRFQAV